MVSVGKYVLRVARLAQVFQVLGEYDRELSLGTLADRVNTTLAELDQDLRIYRGIEEWAINRGIVLDSVLDYPSEGEDERKPSAGDPVRRRATPQGLGLEHVSNDALALVYAAGVALLDLEPTNSDLSTALSQLSELMTGSDKDELPKGRWERYLDLFREAVDHRRRVRILYSGTWTAAITERVVEPLRLVQTSRGWEVDAGPEGNLRTFILSNVRSAELLEDEFPQPGRSLEAKLRAQRLTTTVRVEVPQRSRWVANVYAESVVVEAEAESSAQLRIELLAPVEERLALVMMAAGPTSKILSPTHLYPQVSGVIDRLIRHHEQAHT